MEPEETNATEVGERRWPMALAVLTAVVLQILLPHKQRLPVFWLFPVAEVGMLLAMIVGDPGRIDRRSESLRVLTISLIALMTVANTIAGISLVRDIVIRSAGITATLLLGRGAAIWFTNVIVFSLWFWELDRGGPAERAARSGVPPSFVFPENATPELVREGWMPTYPDYLYLGFTNATAFSPTDTLPIAIWAKMTMMVESAVSLLLGLFVIARAVNII
jgi:hypothetical protein